VWSGMLNVLFLPASLERKKPLTFSAFIPRSVKDVPFVDEGPLRGGTPYQRRIGGTLIPVFPSVNGPPVFSFPLAKPFISEPGITFLGSGDPIRPRMSLKSSPQVKV